MSKIVEVWRLEHVTCPAVSTYNPVKPAHVSHGPWAALRGNYCDRTGRPPFGAVGREPVRISVDHYCGVTRRQMNDWWECTRAEFLDKKKLWRDSGWAFVIYKMPKTRVRWDSNQIVFNPLNAQHRRVLAWDDVPLPRS